MGRFVLRIALGGLALYFHLRGQELGAVLCVILIGWSLLARWRRLTAILLRRLPSIVEEHDANSVLTYTFHLERIVEHPAVDGLFAKLHKNQKAPAEMLEEWRKLLAESYARKYKRDDSLCEVRFTIKNNLLFVNGEPDFRDYVYHELDIPYRWTAEGQPREAPRSTPEIEARLSIRVLLVNGMLLLQIGRFNKEYSPNVLRGGSLGVYETFATITSFPLMYFSYQHRIPERYLNLVAAATPSYKESYGDTYRDAKKKPDLLRDWRALQGDIAAYRVLCDLSSEPVGGLDYVWEKLDRGFAAKRKKLLTAEAYETYGPHEDDWRYPDTGHSYWNRYGTVFFRNVNANRGTRHEAEWFTDYHEEMP